MIAKMKYEIPEIEITKFEVKNGIMASVVGDIDKVDGDVNSGLFSNLNASVADDPVDGLF